MQRGDRRIEVRTDAGQVLTIPLTPDPGFLERAYLVPAGERGSPDVRRVVIWQGP